MPKTLDNEDRLYLTRSYREKALKTLDVARKLLESNPDLSARMSYEAAFNFTAALFVSEGIFIPKTHRGMNSELYQTFVDRGLFPRDIAAYLGQLEQDRNTAQYNPIAKILASDAQKDLQKAEAFCETMQKLVEKNLTELEQNRA